MMRKHSLNMLLHMFPPWVVWHISLPASPALSAVDSWKVSQKEWPSGLYIDWCRANHSVGTISEQEKDSNLSSQIDVFCNKYRFLMVEV